MEIEGLNTPKIQYLKSLQLIDYINTVFIVYATTLEMFFKSLELLVYGLEYRKILFLSICLWKIFFTI